MPKLGAGVAALGCLTLAPFQAEGQIQYVDIEPDLMIDRTGPSVIETLDVDEDGAPDFRFWGSNRSYGIGIRMNGLNSSWSIAGSRFASFFATCTEGMVEKGPAQRPIDSMLDFKNFGHLWINTFPCGDITNWDPEETGYIAIRKQSSSGFRYGWIRATRVDAPFSVGFRLLDYALQSTPDVPIAAGDPGDTCLPAEALEVELLPSIPALETVIAVNWAKVPHALGYRLEVSDGLATNTYTRARNTLLAENVSPGSYDLRVQAQCPSGLGAWSSPLNVTLLALREGETLDEAVSEQALEQHAVAELRLQGGHHPRVLWDAAAEQVHWSLLDLNGKVQAQGHGGARGSYALPDALPSGWYLFRLTGETASPLAPSVLRVWKP